MAEIEILEAVLESDSEEEFDAIVHYAMLIELSLHLPRPRKKRDDYFFTTKFYNFTDKEFLQHFRTTRCGFSVIVKEIEKNPVFYSKSNNHQLHPGWQTAIALMRLGHYGSRTAVDIIASDVGVSGSAVIDYTNRVVKALVSVIHRWIKWPDERQREIHGRLMSKEGFPRCVGFIDGTTLPLAQKPSAEGVSYFDRKKR